MLSNDCVPVNVLSLSTNAIDEVANVVGTDSAPPTHTYPSVMSVSYTHLTLPTILRV